LNAPVLLRRIGDAGPRTPRRATVSGLASDGTAYFSNRSYFTLPRLVFGAGFGVDSCAMRVIPPGQSFEDGYEVDLSALVGGRPAGDFALIDDQVGFIRVFHPELVSEATPKNWDRMSNEAGFKWWRWQIGDSEAREIAGQQPSANTVQVRNIDGQVFALEYAADYSSTTLVEFGSDGSLIPSLRGPGSVYNVIRMR